MNARLDRRALWLTAGVGLILGLTLLRGVGNLRGPGTASFLTLWPLLATTYLLALALQARLPLRLSPTQVLLLALAPRLVALGLAPSLSDDLWRYVWEGRVQWAGVNPYLTPPADPSLIPLHDAVHARVNHPQVPAIYGPLLELLFAALAALPGTFAFRLAFVACDLSLVALVIRLLRRRGRAPGWALAYAWHPLALLEVAGQAHLEVVPVTLLVLALDLHETRRPRGAALALGAAIAAKYLPVLVVPALLVKSRRRLETLALLALPLALCYAPYVLTDPRWGLGLLGGLGAYAERWRFNEGGFGLLDLGLQASGASAALARWLWPDPSYDAGQDLNLLQVAAKALAGAIVLGALAWRLRPRFRLEQSAFLAGALFLLLSPVVHPWYALWILPLLPLRSPRLAWLFLSLALPVSYAVLLTYDGTPATWQESPWTRAIEYAPFAALLLVDGLRARAGDPPA